MKIRIGTRKSPLALAQTELFIKRIKMYLPEIDTEIVHITTKGDNITDRPLSIIGGKGVFVSEIEKALQDDGIDAAVHSAKDLPVILGEGLEISAVLERGDHRDVLVTLPDKDTGCENFTVGTGSLRRRINLKRLYPNAVFKDIRGNVDTRLRKLGNGEFDGIVLAAAGLERLGLMNSTGFTFREFEAADFLPAACQGIIAVQCRKNDPISDIIKQISHKETFYRFEAERKALELMGADCTIPAGAFAEISGEIIRLTVSKDCEKILSGECALSERFELAERLVTDL